MEEARAPPLSPAKPELFAGPWLSESALAKVYGGVELEAALEAVVDLSLEGVVGGVCAGVAGVDASPVGEAASTTILMDFDSSSL